MARSWARVLSQIGVSMLSPEGCSERRWKSLPVLRATLEGRTAPSDGRFCSTDETTVSRLDDLLDVVALAIEHKNAVRERAQVGDRMAVHGEIEKLAAELWGTAEWLRYMSRTVDELHVFIEERPE